MKLPIRTPLMDTWKRSMDEGSWSVHPDIKDEDLKQRYVHILQKVFDCIADFVFPVEIAIVPNCKAKKDTIILFSDDYISLESFLERVYWYVQQFDCDIEHVKVKIALHAYFRSMETHKEERGWLYLGDEFDVYAGKEDVEHPFVQFNIHHTLFTSEKDKVLYEKNRTLLDAFLKTWELTFGN